MNIESIPVGYFLKNFNPSYSQNLNRYNQATK